MSHYILIALFLAGFNGEATAGKDKAAKEKQGMMSDDEAGRSRSRAPSLTRSDQEEVDKMVQKRLAKEEQEKKVARLVKEILETEIKIKPLSLNNQYLSGLVKRSPEMQGMSKKKEGEKEYETFFQKKEDQRKKEEHPKRVHFDKEKPIISILKKPLTEEISEKNPVEQSQTPQFFVEERYSQRQTMSDRDQEDLREKRQKIDKVMKETEYVFHQKWSIQKNYAILMERDSNSYKYKNKDIFNQEFRKIYTMFLSHFEENPMDVLRSMCAIETIWQTEEPRGETHVDPVEFKRIIDLIKTTFVREGFNKTFRDQTNLFDLLSVPKWQDYISRKLYEFNQKISLYTKHLADFEKNPTLEDSSMKIRYRENKYERSLCIFAQLSKKKRLEEALSILDQSPELKEEYKEKIDSIKETKDLFDKLSEIALRNRATY